MRAITKHILMLCSLISTLLAPSLAGNCPASVGDAIITNDIRDTFDALKEVPRTKGEFERSEDFNKRRNDALSSLPTIIPISKPLVHKFSDEYVSYDADNEVFLIRPGAFGAPPHICCSSYPVEQAVSSSPEASALSGISDQEILVEFQKNPTGQYQGSNAYGASATVTKYKEDYWGIYAGDRRHFEASLPTAWYKWYGEPLFRIASQIDQAPSMKKQLRGVIYVTPKPPYTIEGAYLSEATIKNKSERSMFAHYVVGSVDCFAIVDGNGKILAQQRF